MYVDDRSSFNRRSRANTIPRRLDRQLVITGVSCFIASFVCFATGLYFRIEHSNMQLAGLIVLGWVIAGAGAGLSISMLRVTRHRTVTILSLLANIALFSLTSCLVL